MPISNIIESEVKAFEEKMKAYDKDGGFIVYVEGYDNNDFDPDLMTAFLRQSLSQAIKTALTEVLPEKVEIPIVLPPESDAYMYSLAQFNRVAGYNAAIDEIASRISLLGVDKTGEV